MMTCSIEVLSVSPWESKRLAMPDDISSDETKSGPAVVAFIDLLGFGQAVIDGFRDWDQNVSEAYRNTIERVIRAQEIFETPQWKSGQQAAIEGEKTVIALSDSIIWNWPIDNPTARSIGTHNDLLLLFDSLAISQFQCIQQGTFIRGAVDVGFSFHLRTAFVSDALVRAVSTEKDCVCYPVIAVTPHLWNLMEEAGRADSHAKRDHHRIVTTQFTDKEGKLIELRYLDYLRIVGEAEANYRSVLSIHADRLEFALRSAPPKARDKYRWLIAYHNRFIDEVATSSSDLKINLAAIEPH
jgi:hypothetical protein